MPPYPVHALAAPATCAHRPCLHALAAPAICGCSPCDMRLQVVLVGKTSSYYDLEGAAEEKLLEQYGGSGENTASALETLD
eukprot:scaffold45470_cov33-Phaeocystis_antarctica.AAC.1